jgi:hypothetical protein
MSSGSTTIEVIAIGGQGEYQIQMTEDEYCHGGDLSHVRGVRIRPREL